MLRMLSEVLTWLTSFCPQCFYFDEPQVAHDEEPQQDRQVPEVDDFTGGVSTGKYVLLSFGGFLQVRPGRVQQLRTHTNTPTLINL